MNVGALLRMLIQGAMDIPPSAKQGIMGIIDLLPEEHKQRLFQLLRAGTAAGIGAVVSSFLSGYGGPGALAGLAVQSSIRYATPDQLTYRPYL